MPATVSQLRAPVLVTHAVEFGEGVTVEFRYDRNKITDTWINTWQGLERERAANQMNDMLADLIQGWDVQADDGTPYPLSAEALGALFNIPDKMRLLQELMTAAVPTRAEGNGSSVPTSTAPLGSEVQAPTSPNGHTPSPSQVPSASPSLT